VQDPHTKAAEIAGKQAGGGSEAPRPETEAHLLRAASGLLVLIVLMLWWWNYPYPSGKRPDFIDFLFFWGREAILVLFAGVGLAALGLAALWRAIQRAVCGPANPGPQD
jgi:hypothetical protein